MERFWSNTGYFPSISYIRARLSPANGLCVETVDFDNGRCDDLERYWIFLGDDPLAGHPEVSLTPN